MSFKIETSFAFPIVRINTIIKSTKVEKPSGLSYLLLVLINENNDRNALLFDTLKLFGIPDDMIEVFIDEIRNLIELDIIGVEGNFDKNYFDSYLISNFKFTNKGRKIFEDEAIPLGHDVEVKQSVFYNIALKELYLVDNDHLRSSNRSVLDDSFFEKMDMPNEKKIEAFLNTKKSNGIAIKKEEVILDVKIQSQDNGFDSFDIDLLIDENDNIDFGFTNPLLKKFFESHYTKEMISEGILVKGKFKFKVEPNYISKLSEHAPIRNLYRPNDADSSYKIPAHFTIFKEGYESFNNRLSFQSGSILDVNYPNSAFVKIINLDLGYVFIPTYLILNNKVFGNIKISSLLEKELTKEQINIFFKEAVNQFNEFNNNKENNFNFKNLIELTKLDKTNEKIFSKIIEFTSEEVSESIIILEKIKDLTVGNPKIYEFVKDRSVKLLEQLYEDVDSINLESKLTISDWIIKMNKIDEVKHLEIIFNNLDYGSPEKQIAIYNILENYNFTPENIIIYLKDMPKIILDNKTINNKLANELSLLFNLLDDLQSLTKIREINHYLINENINRNDYLKTFKSFNNAYNKLTYLKDYLIDDFSKIFNFHRIFKELNDMYEKEEYAAKNPNKIDKEFLLKGIDNLDMLTTISYIYIKLSFVAKKINPNYDDIFSFIDELEKDKLISKHESKALHKFRMYRNDLIHAKETTLSILKEDLKEVVDIIFRLEGVIGE
jgi:hypothetical protein